MRKNFLTILLLACLVTSITTGYATETRVGSMGGVGYYIHDNSNIFYFPGTINRYQNQVVTELRSKGSRDSYTIGAHLPYKPANAVFGIYLNAPILLPYQFMSQISEVSSSLTLKKTSSLFYGTKLQSFDFGAMISFARDSWNEDRVTSEYNSNTQTYDEKIIKEEAAARYIGIAAGISNKDIDVGLKLDLPGASWESEKLKKSLSGMGFGLTGRFFVKKTSTLQIVPLATFYYGSGSYEDDNGDPDIDNTEIDYGKMDLGLGVGFNYQYDESNMIVLAIEAFGLSKMTEDIKDGDKDTDKYLTLPGIYLGVESKLKSWLTSRIGASQVYQSHTETTKPNKGKETETSSYISNFNITFGFAIVAGSFVLDASFNEGFLFDGPYFLSGTSNAITNRLSLTYNFNKK